MRVYESVVAAMMAVAATFIMCITAPSAQAYTREEVIAIKSKLRAERSLTESEATLARQLGLTGKQARGMRIAERDDGGSESRRPPRNPLDDYLWAPTTYNWVDITTDGILLPLTLDDYSDALDLGFSFDFYETIHTQIYVASHGFVTFESTIPPGAWYTETAIPNTDQPNDAMFVFWDDNSSADNGGIYYYADAVNQRFIVSWNGVGHFGNPGETYSFQVILHANGNIVYQYQQVTQNTSCTVGVENASGDEALQICFDASGDCPQADWAILISQPDGVPAPVSNLTGIVNGADVTLLWVDPTQDTNGNPVTIDSVQIWLGAPNIVTRLGAVLPGAQTFVHTNAPDGALVYYVRAHAGQFWGPPATVGVIVGSPTYAENFDVSNGMWDAQPVEGWQWGSPSQVTPRSAPNVWGVGLNEFYPNGVDWYMYLVLDLAVATPTASVEFWINYDTEFSWDGSNFQISVDDGATWEIVIPEDGYPEFLWTDDPGWTGQSGGWQHVVLPIGQWNGSVPQFRLYFTSDPIINDPGLWIDDMLIWGLQEPAFATVSGTVTLDGGNGNITTVIVLSNGIGSPQTNPAADGTYTLDSVLVGERRLVATLPGYHPDTLVITVPDSGYAGADLTLRRVNPPAPTGLTGTVNSSTGVVTLNWDDSTDPLVDFYHVYRKLESDPNWTLDDTQATSDDTDTLTVDGIYQYAVTAVDDDVVPPAVESALSTSVTVLFGELPPTNLVANGNFDDRIRLNWLSPGIHASYQILYDDSSSEQWFRVTSPNQDQDYFGVRFTPPSADTSSYPMPIQTCNIYMERSDPLPNVWVCPDDNGVPDLTNAYMNWQEIGADGDPGWLIANADGAVVLENDSDFWVVWQFPPGITGPGTGSDDSSPDSRSYWTWLNSWPNWNLWTSHDWMARVWLGGEPGWGFVLCVGEPSGYTAERVPFGQAAPTAEMEKTANRVREHLSSVGPIRTDAPAKAAKGTTTKSLFPVAMEDRYDRPYSVAPALVYQQRPRRGTLDDILYYKIYRDGNFLVNDTLPPYDDVVTSANENVPHTYYVRAHYDNNQDSDSSNHATASANMAPGAPTNVNGNPVGSSQMQITWTDPAVNADGTPCVDLAALRIYRDGNFISTVNPGVQTYMDTPPAPDQFYTWTVNARDEVPNEGPASLGFTGAVTSPWQPCDDFVWVDISGQGTPLTLGDDQYSGTLNIGFTFTYFEQDYTQLKVASNGFLTFNLNDPFAPFTETPIPDPATPNNAIYYFWDDLFPPSGGTVMYYSDVTNGQFIVSYDVQHYPGGGDYYTFEVILGDDGSITMNYLNVPIGNSCTIGVEDATGSNGLQVVYDGDGWVPMNNSCIAFWAGPSGSLEGVVRAFGNNLPIEGVRVETQEVPEFAFTDATGFYSLPLEPGTYTACYTRQGFCDTCFANILIEDNNITVRNVTLRAPAAQFSVSSISQATWPTHDVTAEFEITNPAGQCPLEFTISDTSAWLSTNPASGTVPPNQSVTITVIMSVQGLNPGSDYQSVLVIDHEANGSPYQIPVTLSISLSGDDQTALPSEFALYQNYPNPFNATTSLRFDLPQESRVKIVLFNVMGQAVATVVDAGYPAGRHQVQYEATDLPSGMYLMKLEAGTYSGMKKILLLK